MKRVVHITTMHPSNDTRIFRNECISLAKAGYEVILCAPHPKEEVLDGVKIIPVPKYQTFYERVFEIPAKAVGIAAAIDADMYHFHDPELLFEMATFAKKSKKNVVWDAHENYENTIYSFNSLRVKLISFFGAKVFGWFELKYAKKYFKGVVTITDVMAKKYRNKQIPTAVAGNFSNIEGLPGASPDRLKYPVVFISSGMQFKERAVLEMGQAFSLLEKETNVVLRFAGKFKTEKLKQEILDQVQPAMRQSVELLGPFSWSELVLEQIPQAHVGFVLFDTSDPNNCNGLPNRFFECWSNGLPVITTAGTQVAKLVEQENGGIVIPDNSPESIVKAMKQFIELPELIGTMGKNARKAVEDKYSWNVAFSKLLKLYKTII